MEAYTGFAYIYDKLMMDVDYSNWLDFIKSILERHNKKPREVLEMGCGTGNFTALLCKEGYNVTAFDLSEDMLSVAYNKLDSHRNFQLLKQDMTDFSINMKFDTIISVCDCVNYITEYSELIKTFENAYNHLKSDGVFIFDINSYYKLKNIIGDNVFVEDNEEIFYVWENEYNESDDTCQLYITFFVKEEGLYRRFDELHVEKAYTTFEVENALKKAGFKIVNIYNGYSNESPNNESERLTFVVLK